MTDEEYALINQIAYAEGLCAGFNAARAQVNKQLSGTGISITIDMPKAVAGRVIGIEDLKEELSAMLAARKVKTDD